MFKGWKTIVIKSDEEYEEEKRMARFNPSITKVIEDSQPADAMECGADGNIPEGRPLTKEAKELYSCLISIEDKLQEGREARRELEKYKARCEDYEDKLITLNPEEFQSIQRQLAAEKEHTKRLEASLRIVQKERLMFVNALGHADKTKGELMRINAEQRQYIEELEKRLANGK